MVSVTWGPCFLRDLFLLAPGTLVDFLLTMMICGGGRWPRLWGLLLLRSMWHCKKYMGMKPNFRTSQISFINLITPPGRLGAMPLEVFFRVMPNQRFLLARVTKHVC